MPRKAGIRELKAHLSAYLREVKAGETVVVTDRGDPVARIVPVGRPVEERLGDLLDAGLVEWNEETPESLEPVARTRGGRTVADLLLEDRE